MPATAASRTSCAKRRDARRVASYAHEPGDNSGRARPRPAVDRKRPEIQAVRRVHGKSGGVHEAGRRCSGRLRVGRCRRPRAAALQYLPARGIDFYRHPDLHEPQRRRGRRRRRVARSRRDVRAREWTSRRTSTRPAAVPPGSRSSRRSTTPSRSSKSWRGGKSSLPTGARPPGNGLRRALETGNAAP